MSAMYVSFLISNGLDLFEINLVNLVFYVTLFLTEIPTGAFADVFGRKVSHITACALLAISMLVYGLSSSFIFFAVAESIGAVALTFSSGAFDSWFVDRIKHYGYNGKLDKAFARAGQIGRVCGIASAYVGAALADINMVIPWFAASALFVVSGLVALFIKEEYFVRQKLSLTAGLRDMGKTIQSSLCYCRDNLNVRFVIIITTIQLFVLQAPNMQWQPFFKRWLSGQIGLGIIYVLISVSVLLGSFVAPWLLRKVRCERKTLLMTQSLIALGIILPVLSERFLPALLIFLVHEFARGIFDPIKKSYLHQNITQKERATIQSFESMAHHLGGAGGLLISGLLAKSFGISVSWVVVGMALLLGSLLMGRNGRKLPN